MSKYKLNDFFILNDQILFSSLKDINLESMYFNNTKKNEFDAIVVGSGISGGWAAKELCEAV